MGVDKKKIIWNNIIAAIQLSSAAFVLFVFGYGTCYEILCFGQDGDVGSLIVGIFGDIAGISALYYGITRSKALKALKRYSGVINHSPSISLRDFSQRTGDTEQSITSNLEWLIEHNVLEDAFIDYEDNCVIFDKAYRIERAQEKWNQKYKKDKSKHVGKRVAVVCECCGAVAMLAKDEGGLCEYCRAPIGKDKEKIEREEMKNEME